MKGEPWVIWHGNENLLQHTVQEKMEAFEGREFQFCWRNRPL